jgi:chromate transporter
LQKHHSVGLLKIFLTFLRLGATAFGGPAMMAHVKKAAVTRHGWITEEEFRHGTALCQLIPGATVIQMAAYIGMQLRGIAGALVSFISFGLPAFLIMLALSAMYAAYHDLPHTISLFTGLKAIIVAIIAHAAYLFTCSTIKSLRIFMIFFCSCVLLLAGMNPFLMVMIAAMSGSILFHDIHAVHSAQYVRDKAQRPAIHVWLIIGFFGSAMLALYHVHPDLFSLALLMMKIDLFAFGGGYGSLPLMLHEIVDTHQWMDSKTFMDGIALGQITPGPIVITATFVGYLMHGLSGACIGTITIFTPSFLMLVITMPICDRMKASRFFLRAVQGILASFVGLLFFVLLKFSLTVQWDWRSILLGSMALAALIRETDILYVVIIGGIISMMIY